MKREIGLGYCRHQPPPVVSQGFTKTSAPEKPKVPGFQSWSPEETQFQKKWCQPDLVPLSSTLGIWWPPSATPWGLVELCLPQHSSVEQNQAGSGPHYICSRQWESQLQFMFNCRSSFPWADLISASKFRNLVVWTSDAAQSHFRGKKSAWNSLNRNTWKCSLGPSAYCGKWYITNMLIITAILGGRNNKFVSKALLKFMFLQSPQWILEGMTLGTQLQCFQQVIPFSPSTTKEEKGNLGISALYPLTNKKLN